MKDFWAFVLKSLSHGETKKTIHLLKPCLLKGVTIIIALALVNKAILFYSLLWMKYILDLDFLISVH